MKNNKDRGEVLDLVESTLDAINSSNELYTPLFNMENKTKVTFGSKLENWMKKIFFKKKEATYTNEQVRYSEPLKLLLKAKKETLSQNIDMQNYIKYNPLEEFIYKYKDSNPHLADYLYENAYLSKQKDHRLVDFCKKIKEKYDINILDYSFYEYDDFSAYRLEKELDMFKKLLKPKKPFLNVIKINDADFLYQVRNDVGGYYQEYNKVISLPRWSKVDYLFRHEMIHATDKKNFKGFFRELFGGKPKLSENIIDDLKKGGAQEASIKYAQTKLCEAKAVLGQFDITKYSKSTKDFMVKNGVPKELLKLRNIDYYDYIVNLKPRSEKEIKALKALRNKLGGKIPQKIASSLCYNTDISGIENILKLTKNQKNISVNTLVYVLDYYSLINRYKKDIDGCTKRLNVNIKKLTSEENVNIRNIIQNENEKYLSEISQCKLKIKNLEKQIEEAFQIGEF